MLNLHYLAELLERHRPAAAATVKTFAIGGRPFDFNRRPAVMGVINLSKDSWYRESVCLNTEQAMERANVLTAQGADIIDVGAESTLPHAAIVDDTTQQSQLLPLLRRMVTAKQCVSVETYSPVVARAVLEAGASVLNLTGETANPELYRLVAAHDAAVIICFVYGKNARDYGEVDFSGDFIGAVFRYFEERVALAERHGVSKIFLDPGMGFYHKNLPDGETRVRHQMETFLNTFRLRVLGYPTCHALPHAFQYFGPEVRSAEPFFATLAALGRTDLLRTHEVPRTRAVLRTLQAFQPLGSDPSAPTR